MAKILTGAKAIVRIKDQTVAFASGVTVNQENTLEEVRILGQINPADLAETGVRYTATVNFFRRVDGEATSAVDFDIEKAVLQDMRDQDEFDMLILDESTGNVTFKLEGCKISGGSGNVDSRGVWAGTWNIQARKGLGI